MKKLIAFIILLSFSKIVLANEEIVYCPQQIECPTDNLNNCKAVFDSKTPKQWWDKIEKISQLKFKAGIYKFANAHSYYDIDYKSHQEFAYDTTSCEYTLKLSENLTKKIFIQYSIRPNKPYLEAHLDKNTKWKVDNDAICNSSNSNDCPFRFLKRINPYL